MCGVHYSMLFNSLEFLIFIIPVYLIYRLIQHRWQNRLLIVASCLFYAAWNWKFLGVMFVSITTDYFCARVIDGSEDPKVRKRFLLISIFVNLAILGFFKYFNFFVSNFEDLLRFFHLVSSAGFSPLKIILPLGISFYTFEAISYTFDVYRKIAKPAQKYEDYLLFVIYFPHLIAGPIMRAKDFLPQITTKRVIVLERFYEGCFLFFWGIFEKMFVADNLAHIVNPLFATSAPYQGGAVLLALYAFSFQIFCDFDGYSNMARGLGLCMGFDITINFKLPYFSVNPREYWQRWHISLSSWLRDYLYIPLGGNRHGQAQMYMALLITMLIGGLWHGASWTFVLWGLYQAVLLIGHRIFEKPSEKRANIHPFKRFIKIIIFYHLIILGWLLFRAQSFDQIINMAHALVFNFRFDQLDLGSWLNAACFIAPLLAVQIWQYMSKDLVVIFRQHWLVKVMIYALMTYLVLGWGIMKSTEFIYFQF